MHDVLCEIKGSAKAIAAVVAGFILTYAARRGLHLDIVVETLLPMLATGVIVWFTRNAKCVPMPPPANS